MNEKLQTDYFISVPWVQCVGKGKLPMNLANPEGSTLVFHLPNDFIPIGIACKNFR